ncbi:MAG TPA: GNAT family protein [Candidatus Sumerlaeota bacterium]|nr:GNAT family protein [Candidatus Sumerlaeota bacterium]
MERKEVLKTYPKEVTLRNGDSVTLRLMTQSDEVALLEFFQGLPESDRQFLQEDVTDPEVIQKWVRDLDYNRVLPILAIRDGRIIADATLHMQTSGWSRHVGEIRVAVSRDFRMQRLGFLVTKELFYLAISLGLEKVIAQTMDSQIAVIRILQAIGFRKEAVLTDHVKDQQGQKHDLFIMSHDVKSVWKKMEDLIRDSMQDRSGYYKI